MTDLAAYLERPLTPPDPEITAAIARGPIDSADGVALERVDRLLDPAPLAAETGWCTGYVAVRTPMPALTAEMIDWWFDWHPREALRYRIWHPPGHFDNRLDPPKTAAAKRFWGAVHHPLEDVGTGRVHARIEFLPPTELGLSTDGLDDPAVATVVCGIVGDDRLGVRHTTMFHVFLRAEEGLVLRSHFWLGARLRPQLLKRFLPSKLPPALATHCSEEYANLAALLPELYGRYGP